MFKTALTACFFIACFAASLPAQTAKAYKSRAAERFSAQDFAQALECYRVLLEADSLDLEACYRGGTSAARLRVFALAEAYFGRMPDSLKVGEYADTDYQLGLALKGLGRYEDAADAFLRFLETQPTAGKTLLERANAEVGSCQWALQAVRSPTPNSVQRLPSTLNSGSADFAPARFADRLYFSSTQPTDSLDEQPRSRLFSSANGEPPLPVAGFDLPPGAHASNMSLTHDAQRMYFTTCQETGAFEDFRCELRYRDRSPENGEWGPDRLLPPYINLAGTNNTQPAVGWDRFLGKTVLYFVSDRPGGVGGRDIWASILGDDGQFGKPFCLPTVNTPQDEASPSFQQASQTLFFSSNGRETLGGFDIFFAKKASATDWETPQNMGYPLNSSYDDLYYNFHSASKTAYFSSNRPGGECEDPSGNCTCEDLYQAHIRAGLEVRLFSEVDSAALAGAKVEVTDLTTGKVDSFYVNLADNRFNFPLELDRQYRVRATCPRYMPASAEISTQGLTYFDVLRKDLYLTPGALLVLHTFNAIDKTPLGGAKIELADRKTGQRRSVQNGGYAHGCQLPLEFDRSYDVLATLPGHASAEAIISTEGMVEGDTVFRELLLSPFEGLPLTLFFDNAQPIAVSPEDSVTVLTYGQAVQAFFERKPVFLKGYAAGLKTKKQKQQAQQRIELFFADSVLANFGRLNAFCPLLERYLADSNFHHNIEVLFAGFASPLGDSVSNRRLTARRVSSVINQFRSWNNGALVPYLDSGQLQINLDPRGEEYDPQVSDDPANRRAAEFSPEASRMRRVVITEIRTMQRTEGGLKRPG